MRRETCLSRIRGDMQVKRDRGQCCRACLHASRCGSSKRLHRSARKLRTTAMSRLTLASITAGQHAGISEAATTCARANRAQLEVAGDCAIGAVFAPTLAGKLWPATSVSRLRETCRSRFSFLGNATAANSTTTSVASNLNPAGFGQNVTFTAVVQTGAATGKLSGTVTFFDGAAALASGVVPDAQGSTGDGDFLDSIARCREAFHFSSLQWGRRSHE